MIVTRTKRFPLVHVFRKKSFTLLWSGQTISSLGDAIYRVALAWVVLLLTHSALSQSLVYVASLVPTIIFMLIGGVAADRLPRKLILLVSDGGRGFIVGVVALLAAFHLVQLWHLIVLSLLFGVVESFFMPAYQSIQPLLVDEDELQPANSVSETSMHFSRVIGPSLGALCVAAAGPSSAFVLDALSFLLSVACLLLMRVPSIVSSHEETNPPTDEGRRGVVAKIVHNVRSVMTESGEGLQYITRSRWLLVGIAVAIPINITFMGPLAVSMPRLVHDSYHAGAWLLGGLYGADAVGAILGAMLAGTVPPHKRGLLCYCALLVSCVGLTFLGLPIAAQFWLPFIPLVASVCTGFGFGFFAVIWRTIIQALVPRDIQGRVFSLDTLGSYLFIPAGIVVVGTLTDRFGPSVVFVCGGLLSALFVMAALAVPDVRRLD